MYVRSTLAALLSLAVYAQAADLTGIEAAHKWLQDMTPEQGVLHELEKYQGLPAEYVSQLPATIKGKINQQAISAMTKLAQNTACEDKVIVEFPGRVTDTKAEKDSAIQKFEDSFVRIELVKCMPGVKVSNALKVWLSESFQKNAFPELTESIHKDNRVCQKAKAFGIGKSANCYYNTVFEAGSHAFVNSYVDFNESGIEATTYFRQFLSGILSTEQGSIYYGLMYVRGIDLGGFMKKMGKGKITSSNEDVLKKLYQQSLKAGGAQ